MFSTAVKELIIIIIRDFGKILIKKKIKSLKIATFIEGVEAKEPF